MLSKLFVLLVAASLLAADATPPESVASLIESELAFARAAADQGIKEAFLAYLAVDSVLFRPRAVNGKKWMGEGPTRPGLLQWEPYYAEVSGAGDLGFTTGPFTFSTSPNEEPSAYGQFFSIWEKQPNHPWKVVLDAGIDHEKQESKISLSSRTGRDAEVSKDVQTSEKRAVASADSKLSHSFVSEFVADDVIVLRNLHPPSRGKASAKNTPPKVCTFEQEQIRIAKSADLAYTYGTYKCQAEAGVYVRIWRKEDHWRLALDYLRAD